MDIDYTCGHKFQRRPGAFPQDCPECGKGMAIGVNARFYMSDETSRKIRDAVASIKPLTRKEWDGEGLPPVGAECRMTLGFVEYDHIKITYMGDGVFCYLNKRTKLEYTGALCDATFRPLRTQHERQRDSLAELCRTKFNQQTSSANPYVWSQLADAILAAGWRKAGDQ